MLLLLILLPSTMKTRLRLIKLETQTCNLQLISLSNNIYVNLLLIYFLVMP